jgi:hypothetical protein
MRNLLLAIIIAAILVAVLPPVLNSKRFSFLHPKAESTPPPAPAANASSATDGWVKHPSGLGGRGGLGAATMVDGNPGRLQVYTCGNLPAARDGQIVRIRFSRPRITVSNVDAQTCDVTLDDKDHGAISVTFPKAAAEKLALPYSKTQPGLTFFIALEPAGTRFVGTTWNAATKTYYW